MPEHEGIKNLLSGTNINYFHCLQIVDILKETEKDTKNFFGSYGSKRMKDWQDVIHCYQRDQIYIAEAAQLLSQAVTYEIPGLKKQLAKSIQAQEECDKKEKDNDKKATEFQKDFEKSCQQLGITGKKIRSEIIALLKDLPETYAGIAAQSKELKGARDIYCKFLSNTLDEGYPSDQEVLPTLQFLMEHGNVTTYQWIHGEAPLSVEETALEFGEDEKDEDETAEDDGVIDFGDDDEGAGIDFNTDDVELDSGGDIDWGNLDTGDAAEIDWSTSEALADIDDSTALDIVVEDGGTSGGVARDSEALSILDNRRTRMAILDELTELECFLSQRAVEQEAAEGGDFSLGYADAAKDANAKVLLNYVSQIRALTGCLTAGKIHHLQLIRSSPKYVDRMVEGLKKKIALVDRMKLSNQALSERREQAIRDQATFQKKAEQMKTKAKELQKNIEEDISKRYKNRPVNIMGGAQSV